MVGLGEFGRAMRGGRNSLEQVAIKEGDDGDELWGKCKELEE